MPIAAKQLPDRFIRPYLESIIAAVFAEVLTDEAQILSLAKKAAELITDDRVRHFFYEIHCRIRTLATVGDSLEIMNSWNVLAYIRGRQGVLFEDPIANECLECLSWAVCSTANAEGIQVKVWGFLGESGSPTVNVRGNAGIGR